MYTYSYLLRYNFSGDLRLDMLKTFYGNEIFPSLIAMAR